MKNKTVFVACDTSKIEKIRTIILTQNEFKKLSKTLDVEHSFLI